MRLFLIDGGYCQVPQKALSWSYSWSSTQIPAMYLYFEHAGKRCLFDTGYTRQFLRLPWSECWYHLITPVPSSQFPEGSEFPQAELPFRPEEIDLVFVSHFHPDHISGLKQLPRARIVAWQKPCFSRLHGVLPSLFPEDWESRLELLSERAIDQRIDYFGDGQVVFFPLPGHCAEQMGVFLGGRWCGIGDAAWSIRNFRDQQLPPWWSRWVHGDASQYRQTLQQLRHLWYHSPRLEFLPSHCPEVYQRYLGGSGVVELTPTPLPREISPTEKILVTGATGFIGGHLVAHLAQHGYTVVATGRNPTKLQALAQQWGVITLPAELSNSDSVSHLSTLGPFEAVIHTAARCQPWGKKEDFWRDNVLAVQHLVKLIPCRLFVFFSSPSVYFGHQTGARRDVSEDHPWEPDPNLYSWSKREAETWLYQNLPRAKYLVLRPRGVFGPGDQVLLPRLLDRMKRGKMIQWGGAETRIDLTYVKNVVLATEKGLQQPESWGTAYHLTNQTSIEIWSLLGYLQKLLRYPAFRAWVPYSLLWWISWGLEKLYGGWNWFGGAGTPPLTRYQVNLLGQECRLDPSLAQTYLHYYPEVTLEAGIQQTLEPLRQARETELGVKLKVGSSNPP